MKKRSPSSWPIVVITIAVLLLVAAESFAIPSFARRYATSCSTCHVAIPKLNAYGDAFRRNGYTLPEGDKAMVKQKPIELGAKAWKDLWPHSLFPGEIPANIPFGVYMHQRGVLQFSEDPNKDTFLFDAPHELELLMGMSLGKKFGVFGEWIFYEKEENAAGLKRLFITFNDMFSTHGNLPENALNIKFGRFEPGTMGGYKDATKRLTMEHPITGDLRVLDGTGLDFAPRWRMRDPQSGIELNGVLGHYFEYAVGYLNGESQTVSESGDINSKDSYARVAYKFGGMGFDGHGVGEGLNDTENWRDDSVTLGLYYYRGATGDPGPETENDFDRLGMDFRWQLGAFDLLAGYIQGTDELSAMTGEDDVASAAWFIEPNYRFLPWLIGLVRYEEFKVDFDNIGGNPLKEGTRINPHLLILIRPNIRFGLEYLYEKRDWWEGAIPEAGTDNAMSSKWVKANFQIVF